MISKGSSAFCLRAPSVQFLTFPFHVIPAQAGIRRRSLGESMDALARHWIPAFAGMTWKGNGVRHLSSPHAGDAA